MERNRIIHVGYGDSAAGCLRAAMRLGLDGNKVVVSRDDFTQGPINHCLEDTIVTQRVSYWQSLSTIKVDLIDDIQEHYWSSLRNLSKVTEGDLVCFWIGHSAHDYLATGWLLHYWLDMNLTYHCIYLGDHQKLSTLPLVNLAMLTPEQVVLLNGSIVPMSQEQLQRFKNLWMEAADTNSAYRILQRQENDERIVSVADDYHDEFILSQLSTKGEYLGKVIGRIMGHSAHRLTDVTIEHRLVRLSSMRKVKIDANMGNHYLSKVRRKV